LPLLFPSPSAATPLAAAVTGAREERSGWVFDLADLVSTPAEVAWAALSVSEGQKTLGTKSSCTVFYFQKNCCKYLKFVKCIEYSLYVRKMQMTYQNVQKNEIYILVSKS
jgi:hypothetical protein